MVVKLLEEEVEFKTKGKILFESLIIDIEQ